MGMGFFDNTIDKIYEKKKYHFWIFFMILVALSLIMMYAYKPLCPGMDFHFHYRRLQALMDGIKENHMLIYLDYNAIDGYGYFTKAFYSDFILIPFAIIGNLTNVVFAYQSMIFITTLACGLFTYWCVDKIYNNKLAAGISAILYTFAYYRLLDIYDRAAIGEALSFTFIPIVFLGLYHIITGDYKKWYILSIGVSLIILTHLISAVLTFVTIIIFLVIYHKRLIKEPKRIVYLIIAGLVCVLLTAYYVYPMLEQMQGGDFYYETKNLTAKAEDAKLGFNWIIWGLFSGIVHPAQAFVPGTGIMLTLAVALRLFVDRKSNLLKITDILVVIGLLYILASSILFPWGVFPFNKLNFIQLPWRLYEFTSFFFAVAGGFYLTQALKSRKRILIACLGFIIITVFGIISMGKAYQDIRCKRDIAEKPVVGNNYNLGGMEYIPSKVPSIEYIAERGSDSITTRYEQTAISNFNRSRGKTSFDIKLNNTQEVLELPLFYYKGYAATINSKPIAVEESKNGLVQIPMEQSGRVEAYYGGTTVQKVSYYITMISSILLSVYIFSTRRYNNRFSKKSAE